MHELDFKTSFRVDRDSNISLQHYRKRRTYQLAKDHTLNNLNVLKKTLSLFKTA